MCWLLELHPRARWVGRGGGSECLLNFKFYFAHPLKLNPRFPAVIDLFLTKKFVISNIIGKGRGSGLITLLLHFIPVFFDNHFYLTKITLLPWWKLWIFLLQKYQWIVWMTQTCTRKWHVHCIPLKLNVAILIILAETIQKSQLNNNSQAAIFRR